MENFDWSTFTRKMIVYAPVEIIYKAWATPGGLESWFLKKAAFKNSSGMEVAKDEYLKAGDNYQWWWHGYSDEVVESGKVLEANGKDHFRFVFGEAGIVDVKIKMVDGETLVELVQEAIPTDEKSRGDFHVGCSVGWIYYLCNLKSILEGGIDLRNKKAKILEIN